MYITSKAVARLFIQGSGACTGFIVGPTPRNQGSLLLTNQHCIDSNTQASNTEYEFLGEEAECGGTTGWNQDKGTSYFTATLLK
eukprot:9401827-Ditylum_brightwellii.AAC.1